jgi:hypothetical protein
MKKKESSALERNQIGIIRSKLSRLIEVVTGDEYEQQLDTTSSHSSEPAIAGI